jgi:hypothetical protein
MFWPVQNPHKTKKSLYKFECAFNQFLAGINRKKTLCGYSQNFLRKSLG